MAYKINTVFTATYDNLKATISSVKTQFKSVENAAESAKKSVSNAFSTANKDISNVNKSIKESSELINTGLKASAIGIATITVPTILAGKSALTMAGKYESATQTLEYTLGEAKSIVDDFVEHNAQAIGMAEQEAYKFANIYSNLLTTMTNDQKTNAEYTNKLMQASAVIMSKTGRTFTDVADRIRSGLLGNTEAIEDLGVNVNIALLETTDAFNKIADGRSWEKLSFQEQQQVRLLGILEQTTKKYGEEVGDNLSLKLSQMGATFENVKTGASQFLSVGLQPILSGINNVLTGIQVFVKYLNTLDDGTKQTITTFIAIIAIIPVVAVVFLTLIKAINSYVIFTKIASASTATLAKSMIGLLGAVLLVVAGIAMIAYSLGAFNNTGKGIKKTTNNTANAIKAVDGLSASENANADSAKKASKANKELADNLQGFDEINKLNLDSSTSNLDNSIGPTVDLSGIDTSAFDNIENQFGNLNDKIESFKKKMEELRPTIGIVGGVLTALGIGSLVKDVSKLIKKLPKLKSGLQGISSIGAIAITVTLGIIAGKWYADNIGEISPLVTKMFKEKYGDNYDEKSGIYRFGINLQYVITSMGTKLIDLIPGITEEDAINYLTNVGNIITNVGRLINIFDFDTFSKSWQGVWSGLKNLTKDTIVGEFFQACFDFVSNTIKLINIFNPEEMLKSWQNVWSGIKNWFGGTGVGEFFQAIYNLITGKDWNKVWDCIKIAGQNMWNSFDNWWQDTGVPNWWNNHVSPWFTKEKWSGLSNDAKIGLENKFTEFKNKFSPIKDWWNEKIAPWFTWEKWKNLGQDAVNGIKSAFSNMNLSFKLPHFSWTTTPATGWIADILGTLNLPTSLPKLNVSWYKNGGVFSGDSIIGVGEYAGARSNPEIVAPKSMIYDANIEAIKDSRQNQGSYIGNGSDTIKKKVEIEMDLKSGGVKLGKQIIDIVLDANDFYDLGLI